MLLNNRYEYNPQTDLIGKGGMAEVYKAYDRQRECYVALKMFTTPDNLKYSIKSEFQKSLQFAHGNIVRAYDFFTITRTYDDGHQHETQYGVMKLVEGGDLTNYLQQKPHPAELIEVVKGILEGLHYLHTPDPTTNKGIIIHRDIKPGNILIFRNNEGKPIPKIADFNVAKEVSAGSDSSISMVGTYEYMAPEQLNATKYGKNGRVQPNADLWALGVILCDYFLGTSVFGRRSLGNTQGEIIGNVLDKELPIADIKKLRPPFDQLILKCLVRHAAERAQTAKELIRLIDAEATVTSPTPVELPKPGTGNEPEIDTIYLIDTPDEGPTPTPDPPKPPGGGNALFQVIGVLAVVLVTVLLTLYLNKGDMETNFQDKKEVIYSAKIDTISNAQPIPTNLTSDISAKHMVLVQGGTYTMGDIFGEGGVDETPHEVTLSDFYIGKYEVTVEEFKTFIEATRYKTDAEKHIEGYGSWTYKDGDWKKQDGVNWRYDVEGNIQTNLANPVIHVTWNDAVAYCKWLSQVSGNTYRLPTEAEWEYAAREGGAKVRFGNGKDILNPTEANFDGRKLFKQSYSIVGELRGQTLSVGSFPSNSLGLYDMSGNVWEWCSDWYSEYDYSNSPRKNPQGPDIGSDRVLRGGSWDYIARGCRVSNRLKKNPTYRCCSIGFRVVLVP